jgi:hypothetical protein
MEEKNQTGTEYKIERPPRLDEKVIQQRNKEFKNLQKPKWGIINTIGTIALFAAIGFGGYAYIEHVEIKKYSAAVIARETAVDQKEKELNRILGANKPVEEAYAMYTSEKTECEIFAAENVELKTNLEKILTAQHNGQIYNKEIENLNSQIAAAKKDTADIISKYNSYVEKANQIAVAFGEQKKQIENTAEILKEANKQLAQTNTDLSGKTTLYDQLKEDSAKTVVEREAAVKEKADLEKKVKELSSLYLQEQNKNQTLSTQLKEYTAYKVIKNFKTYFIGRYSNETIKVNFKTGAEITKELDFKYELGFDKMFKTGYIMYLEDKNAYVSVESWENKKEPVLRNKTEEQVNAIAEKLLKANKP